MRKKQGRRQVAVWPGAFVGCLLLMCCPRAFGLDPSLDVGQYAHTAWKIRDGFAKGTIAAIAQTPDGYLWLGTEFGLLRFDGIKAVPWQPPEGQHLPSDWIVSLLAARDGTLWIGTSKGLASWKDGNLSEHSELASQYVYMLLEDHERTVWAGTRGAGNFAGRLCAIHNGNVQCYGEDGALGPGVTGLYEDRKENLWVGVGTGLWRWKPGPQQFYTLPREPNGIRGLADGDDGALLVGMGGGIRRFIDGKTEPYLFPGSVPRFETEKLLRDRDGSLWIGTRDHGIVHVHQGRTDVLAASDGLSGAEAHSLLEDREGNIWVATSDGLDRFRDFAVATFSVNQGSSNALVGSVLAAKDGSVWLGTVGGLNRWNKGRITVVPTGSHKRDGKLDGQSPNALFQDGQGRVWVSTQRGLGYLENDRFIPITGIPGRAVHAIAEDAGGNLWIANQDFGLFRLSRAGEIQQIPWARLGRKDPAYALAADTSRGGLWLGFYEGGVAYFKDGKVRTSYAAADGLGEGAVTDFRVEPDGTLWAATQGGLSRLKNGRVATLTSKNGLPCDTAHWVMEDDDHSFWLYMPCGLVRIARSELNAWGADVKHIVVATVFDNSDGVRSRPFAAGYSPRVAKSPDGRLWFLRGDGVSIVDPRHLHLNALPPPVSIEQITADRKTYDITDVSGGVRLPPLVRDLEIDYTALSLVAPEKNRFRYKLEGRDSDWQDAGNRRQAFYTDLPPRNYRFRVIASNNSGVWNETGASLDFSVAPAYYQTTWFRLSCAVAFMAMLWGLHRLRLRQMAGQVNVRMEERLGERMRIARDLHDTLLQSFHGLLLRFQAVSNELPPGKTKQKLDGAIDQAAEAITEGRDAVQGLRSSTVETNDLALAITAIGEELAADAANGHPVEFGVQVEGTPRVLHPILRDEVYRIAGEALRNAFRHAQPRQIEVEIRYDERQLRVRIRDDGKGIDQKFLGEEGREGHFGLHGMRERAKLLGGKLTVWSELDSGTEVELSIPASHAYEKSSASRRSRLTEKLTEKFFGKDAAMKS